MLSSNTLKCLFYIGIPTVSEKCKKPSLLLVWRHLWMLPSPCVTSFMYAPFSLHDVIYVMLTSPCVTSFMNAPFSFRDVIYELSLTSYFPFSRKVWSVLLKASLIALTWNKCFKNVYCWLTLFWTILRWSLLSHSYGQFFSAMVLIQSFIFSNKFFPFFHLGLGSGRATSSFLSITLPPSSLHCTSEVSAFLTFFPE